MASNITLGFRKEKDVTGALFDSLANVQSSLDNQKKSTAVIIDRSKVFDTIDQEAISYWYQRDYV